MITIGICDNNTQETAKLHEYIQDIMQPISDWQSRIYKNSEAVINEIQNNTFDCNLLFMDIVMPGRNGLDLARYFYEHHIDTDFIFITTSKEYVYECYRYRAFAYLLKPLCKEDIANELTRYLKEITNIPKCLNISIKNVHHRIPLYSITYLESDCRKILIHTSERYYAYYDKLDNLEAALAPYGFLRCHQSFLVPAAKISSYEAGQIIVDDCTIPVSNRYRHQIEALFKEYVCPSDVTRSPLVTRSLALNQGITGAIVCTKGLYLGSIIRFYADQEIQIGRDGSVCDVVLNLPRVSRKHCSVIYDQTTNTYEITDYSQNGTFLLCQEKDVSNTNEPNQYKRLPGMQPVRLEPGATLCFGDTKSIYRLI